MDPTEIDKRPHSSLVLTPPNSSTSQSRHARHGMSTEMGLSSNSSCCCGRRHCAYLQHNTAALNSLERHLRSAAQLGQVRLTDHLCQTGNLDWPWRSRTPWLLHRPCSPARNNYSSTQLFHCSTAPQLGCWLPKMSLTFALQNLLIRHEAYVASAEEERSQMVASIEKLEEEKRGLEVANSQIIAENRNLLDDLEGINDSLSNSDARIQSLTSALDSTRDELERLNVLATRSSRLEAQLLEMEMEQSRLQSQLVSTELDCRSATQRWKSAERTIATLQEYVDRIEDEASKERERHAEVLFQFERRRSVERELENAAGRLKGAAAVTRLGRDQASDNVVSHFVTDILHDNANLQKGIVELRELLASSNEEIETLRDQMLVHQPALPLNGHDITQTRLRSELAMSSATESRSEFHIYHHYQSTGRLVREKSRKVPRPRKTRNFTSSELLTQRSGGRTPRNSSTRAATNDAVATLGSKASSSSSSSQLSPTHRWSTDSSQAQLSIAPSTVPSSPRSIHHNPSIFDTLDSVVDFSRPTSPESLSVESPKRFSHHRATSDASFTNLARPPRFNPKYSVSNRVPSQPAKQTTLENLGISLGSPASPHETEEDPPTDLATANQGSNSENDEISNRGPPPFRPRLHRSASHESILSIPSSPFRQPPSHLFNPAMLPSCAVLTHTPATALPVSHALRLSSSTYNRSLLSNLRGSPSFSSSGPTNVAAVNNTIHRLSPGQQPKQPQTLGERVGGWVLGKWGLAPMASTGDLRAQANKLSVAPVRATGVNQKGSVRGLAASAEKKKVRAEVHVGVIDEGLLKESLAEG